jgi:hypothetical protein
VPLPKPKKSILRPTSFSIYQPAPLLDAKSTEIKGKRH